MSLDRIIISLSSESDPTNMTGYLFLGYFAVLNSN